MDETRTGTQGPERTPRRTGQRIREARRKSADQDVVAPRRGRQGSEIIRLIEARRLDHAADLAHEHLVEFPDDCAVRSAIVVALDRSAEARLRRRAGEFAA